MTAARELLAKATPRPWSADDKGGYGAVASTDSAAIERFLERYPEHGASDVEAYGGALVGESIQAPDRALIVAAVNEYEALLAIEEAVENLLDDVDEAQAEDLRMHDLEHKLGAIFLGFGGGHNHEGDLKAAFARLAVLREVTRDANAPSL